MGVLIWVRLCSTARDSGWGGAKHLVAVPSMIVSESRRTTSQLSQLGEGHCERVTGIELKAQRGSEGKETPVSECE